MKHWKRWGWLVILALLLGACATVPKSNLVIDAPPEALSSVVMIHMPDGEVLTACYVFVKEGEWHEIECKSVISIE